MKLSVVKIVSNGVPKLQDFNIQIQKNSLDDSFPFRCSRDIAKLQDCFFQGRFA